MRALGGAGLAAVVVPGLAAVGDGSAATFGTALPAVAAGLAAAVLVRRLPQRSPSWIGGLVVAGCAWLLSQARTGAIDWLLAAILGLGVACALPRGLAPRDPLLIGACTAATTGLAVAAAALGPQPAQAWGALCGVCLGIAAAIAQPPAAEAGPRSANHRAVLGTVLALMVGTWVGANSASATWFGALTSHGPRDRPLVALTFDDGPNATATLAIKNILDTYGVKATFFTVGKALDARPDISRALLADGHLLGNHSYHHDSLRWLDPSYPELARTQQAFRRDLGICPALFRPPHGQHTPFMAWVVHQHGMRMATWDVSVGDWAANDPRVIVQRVLDRVRPGSIIDLHDGLDGRVGVDRTVLVKAMPAILDGLQARRLQPVTLDRLLGVPGYLAHC
jgi:peptidoglycan/xylan/chitin deacetylase (PgdA/CDA1 family)